MATLTVWKFDSETGADDAVRTLENLQKQELIMVHDALGGALTDVGIDDDFIKQIRDQVTPGTSALFVMTSGAVLDKVQDAFAGQRPQLISTNLSQEQEDALRTTFAE